MWASLISRLTLTFSAVPSPPQRSVNDGWPLPHAHNTHRSACSCPLRAYPYKRIRRPVMETPATWSHNLPLGTSRSDQSLFRCLRGSCEMSLAGVWEVWGCVHVCGWGYSMSDARFIYLTCWVQIHIVHWLGVSRGAITYYLWRVLHLWFIQHCSRDCAGTLYYHYGFKRDLNFLCPS